jgi:hypothetical protein
MRGPLSDQRSVKKRFFFVLSVTFVFFVVVSFLCGHPCDSVVIFSCLRGSAVNRNGSKPGCHEFHPVFVQHCHFPAGGCN